MECKNNTCSKLCIKQEIGDNGSFSRIFSRAPANSESCLDACFLGCTNKGEDNQD